MKNSLIVLGLVSLLMMGTVSAQAANPLFPWLVQRPPENDLFDLVLESPMFIAWLQNNEFDTFVVENLSVTRQLNVVNMTVINETFLNTSTIYADTYQNLPVLGNTTAEISHAVNTSSLNTSFANITEIHADTIDPSSGTVLKLATGSTDLVSFGTLANSLYKMYATFSPSTNGAETLHFLMTANGATGQYSAIGGIMQTMAGAITQAATMRGVNIDQRIRGTDKNIQLIGLQQNMRFQADTDATSVVSDFIALQQKTPVNSGGAVSMTTSIGLDVEEMPDFVGTSYGVKIAGSSATNAWGVYVENGTSFFGGNVSGIPWLNGTVGNFSIMMAEQGTFSFVDKLELQSPPSAPSAGVLRLFVQNDSGFSRYNYIDELGVIRSFNDDEIIVMNVRGTTIAAHRIVYATGNEANITTVDTARADNISTMPGICVTIESIANGTTGRCIQTGQIDNVNTNSYDLGTIYVSDTTAGIPTNTPPLTPNLTQEIGTILVKSATVGRIQIISRALTGNEFGTINNFTILGNATAQEFLSLKGIWSNVSITESQITDLVHPDGSGNTTLEMSHAVNISSANMTYLNVTNLIVSNSTTIHYTSDIINELTFLMDNGNSSYFQFTRPAIGNPQMNFVVENTSGDTAKILMAADIGIQAHGGKFRVSDGELWVDKNITGFDSALITKRVNTSEIYANTYLNLPALGNTTAEMSHAINISGANMSYLGMNNGTIDQVRYINSSENITFFFNHSIIRFSEDDQRINIDASGPTNRELMITSGEIRLKSGSQIRIMNTDTGVGAELWLSPSSLTPFKVTPSVSTATGSIGYAFRNTWVAQPASGTNIERYGTSIILDFRPGAAVTTPKKGYAAWWQMESGSKFTGIGNNAEDQIGTALFSFDDFNIADGLTLENIYGMNFSFGPTFRLIGTGTISNGYGISWPGWVNVTNPWFLFSPSTDPSYHAGNITFDDSVNVTKRLNATEAEAITLDVKQNITLNGWTLEHAASYMNFWNDTTLLMQLNATGDLMTRGGQFPNHPI